jgi:hypothetical protein
VQNVKLDLRDLPSAATAVLKQLLCNERPREAQPTVITNQTHIQEGLDNERARREAAKTAAQVSALISRAIYEKIDHHGVGDSCRTAALLCVEHTGSSR